MDRIYTSTASLCYPCRPTNPRSIILVPEPYLLRNLKHELDAHSSLIHKVNNIRTWKNGYSLHGTWLLSKQLTVLCRRRKDDDKMRQPCTRRASIWCRQNTNRDRSKSPRSAAQDQWRKTMSQLPPRRRRRIDIIVINPTVVGCHYVLLGPRQLMTEAPGA